MFKHAVLFSQTSSGAKKGVKLHNLLAGWTMHASCTSQEGTASQGESSHAVLCRLDDVRQLGVDRLVDFSFGQGPACHHLLLELYAQARPTKHALDAPRGLSQGHQDRQLQS